MQQKTTWMNYLIIGLISLSIIGCGDIIAEVPAIVDFEYFNNSSEDILFYDVCIDGDHSSLLIEVGRKKTIIYDDIIGGGDQLMEIVGKGALHGVLGSTLFGKYGEDHCIVFQYNGPHEISNYQSLVISSGPIRHYRFIYEFTDLDFVDATKCIRSEWVYTNHTQYTIKYGLEDIFPKLEPDKSFVFYKKQGIAPSNVAKDSYVLPFGLHILIVFNDSYCDVLNAGEGILGVANYRSEKLEDDFYRFTYIFTNQDYEKAEPCE